MPTTKPQSVITWRNEAEKQAQTKKAKDLGFKSLNAYLRDLQGLNELKIGAPEGNQNKSSSKQKKIDLTD